MEYTSKRKNKRTPDFRAKYAAQREAALGSIADLDAAAIRTIQLHTQWDIDTARAKLAEHGGPSNVLNVLREYRGITKQSTSLIPESTNQAIYKEFRTKMDDVMSGYQTRVEEKEKQQRDLENNQI